MDGSRGRPLSGHGCACGIRSGSRTTSSIPHRRPVDVGDDRARRAHCHRGAAIPRWLGQRSASITLGARAVRRRTTRPARCAAPYLSGGFPQHPDEHRPEVRSSSRPSRCLQADSSVSHLGVDLRRSGFTNPTDCAVRLQRQESLLMAVIERIGRPEARPYLMAWGRLTEEDEGRLLARVLTSRHVDVTVRSKR